MKPAVALGLVAGCAFAIAFYACVRLGQFLFAFEPNPATVIASAHSGFLWRVWIASYGGGMAALLGYWLARRNPARVARVLALVLPAAAALLVAQALFVP
jgi:hypothetical protein